MFCVGARMTIRLDELSSTTDTRVLTEERLGVFSQALDDGCAHGDVGHKMSKGMVFGRAASVRFRLPIHHVQMQVVCTRIHDLLRLIGKTTQIAGQHRGSDLTRALVYHVDKSE